MTPAQLVTAGEGVFNGAGGCTTCHGLGTRAPNLLTDERGQGPIGARCGGREPGKSCKDYLFESLTNPTAYVVAGYQPIMPDMRRTLPPDQIWAVIAFLESHGGTVDISKDDIHASQASAPAAPPPGRPAPTRRRSSTPTVASAATACTGRAAAWRPTSTASARGAPPTGSAPRS